jgi:hypothetical protein
LNGRGAPVIGASAPYTGSSYESATCLHMGSRTSLRGPCWRAAVDVVSVRAKAIPLSSANNSRKMFFRNPIDARQTWTGLPEGASFGLPVLALRSPVRTRRTRTPSFSFASYGARPPQGLRHVLRSFGLCHPRARQFHEFGVAHDDAHLAPVPVGRYHWHSHPVQAPTWNDRRFSHPI